VCCGCEWTRGGERSEKRRERREHDGMEEAEEWEAEYNRGIEEMESRDE